MTNGNSDLFKGTSGDIIGKLQVELAIAKDDARYWQSAYEKANHDYYELKKTAQYWRNRCEGIEHDHEMLIKTLGEREKEVRELRSKATAADSFLAHRAHDIALAALKMEWKKGEIHHQNDSGSVRYYLAAYKYILEQLEADQNKD